MQLTEVHSQLGAKATTVNGVATVADFGAPEDEYRALTERAGLLDLSCRGRLCLTGADRVRFLHGQVTNDIKSLRTGQGCYAAVATAKGKVQSDLMVYALADELLLDFEPGLSGEISARMEKFIVSDDVQVVDIAQLYSHFSIQGPEAEQAAAAFAGASGLPNQRFHFTKLNRSGVGEVYLMNRPRLGTRGFDLFIPAEVAPEAFMELGKVVGSAGGRACGWTALEQARIEAGIPRFGVDMDANSFPQECGIDSLAVSYRKGCYIGQEVLNRIHSMGHVNRGLYQMKCDAPADQQLTGRKLMTETGKEVGNVTSASKQTGSMEWTLIGMVRREAVESKTDLVLRESDKEFRVRVVRPISLS